MKISNLSNLSRGIEIENQLNIVFIRLLEWKYLKKKDSR